MCWRLCLAAMVTLLLAGPALADGKPVGYRQPLLKVTPLRDGRYLLEPLAQFGMATRPRVNSQPNPNLPTAPPGGGQNPQEQLQAGPAANGSPAGQPGS